MSHMPYGYQDGVNIVTYKSIQELKQKIVYYLDNAQERLGKNPSNRTILGGNVTY